MSNEFDSQITESVFKDKFLTFLKKKKYYLFVLFFVLVCLPILYQIFLSLDEKKHKNELEIYSQVISIDNKVLKESRLKSLLKSDNEVVAILSLHRLFESINSTNQELRLSYIEELLSHNSISKNNKQLIKIKKSLLIFDDANEKEILQLLNSGIEKSYLKKISYLILYDFYIKNNQKIKADEFMGLINENN